MRSVYFLILVALPLARPTHAQPVRVSGVYPAFAAFNSPPDRPRPAMEAGLGALVNWAGKLWYLSYDSHNLYNGPEKLHTVDSRLRHEERPESVGGTHACRMIHRESNQLVIGPYFVDSAGRVRVVPRQTLPGRLTAVTRHLTDPARKVLFFTQEGSLYEVDVRTLAATVLFRKPLPGWHGKGAYTSQGVVVLSNNGEEPAPSPFWQVDYSDYPRSMQKTLAEVNAYLQTPNPTGPEDLGALGEWNGQTWTLVARRQYTEVTGPGALRGAARPDEPVWATGWDDRSLLLSVRDAGRWEHRRFLKPSYSLEGPNGSYTEWPRIRPAGGGRYLAFMNGGLFDFPATMSHRNAAGLRPRCSLLRTVTDWDTLGRELVLASQETSVHGIQWSATPVPGQPQANLHFTRFGDLPAKGPAVGWGGVWRHDTVRANAPSDPLHLAGYAHRTLHLSHRGSRAVRFTLEIDPDGTGRWVRWRTVALSPGGYAALTLPPSLRGEWLRVRSDRATVASAYLHGYSARPARAGEAAIFDGLVRAGTEPPAGQSVLRPGFPTRNLQYLLTDATGRQTYREVDETLAIRPVTDTAAVNLLNRTHQPTAIFTEDAASILVERFDGLRFRLPKGPAPLPKRSQRTLREVVQERFLANLRGTFYEIPRYGRGERNQVNQPDFRRMKPVASHALALDDYTTWRGLLVLSGVRPDAPPDGHVFRAPDGAALWFGEVDDLWKLGKPTGTGGPWLGTPVRANEPSDPYLMTGYDRKTLRLRHDAPRAVRVTVEVDFLADGSFHPYQTLTVPAGKTLDYNFPTGFSAHWVRFRTDTACAATAQLTYR